MCHLIFALFYIVSFTGNILILMFYFIVVDNILCLLNNTLFSLTVIWPLVIADCFILFRRSFIKKDLMAPFLRYLQFLKGVSGIP